MKRPLPLITGVFVLGEVLGLYVVKIAAAGFLLPAAIILICLFLGFFFYQKNLLLILLPLLLVLGFLRGQEAGQGLSAASLPPVEVLLEGRVAWMESRDEYHTILLHVNSINDPNMNDNSGQVLVYLEELPELKIGNTIQVKGRLRSFDKPRNPGQFDYAHYNQLQGIQWRMNGDKIIRLDSKEAFPDQELYSLRSKFLDILDQVMEERDAGLYRAVLLGEKSRLEEEVRELYQLNGISHLLAISGLHVSILGSGIYQRLRKISGSYLLAVLISGGIMVCYGILAGGGASVSRALIMYGVHLAADLFGRKYDMLSAISLAAMIQFFGNPLYLLAMGVQMSYGAVLGIAIIVPLLQKLFPGRPGQILIPGLAIQLVTIPLSMYHTFEYPRYGFLINLLVLPLMSMAVGSGLLAVFLGMFSLRAGAFAAGIGHYIFAFYEQICYFFSDLPFARHITGQPALWQIFLYFLLLIAAGLMLQSKIMKKCYQFSFTILFLLVSILVLFRPVNQLKNRLAVTFLDVGQGDGIVIREPRGSVVLVDGGSLDVKSVGKNRIGPFLKFYGISDVDYVVLTHMDEDHISGIRELIENPSIGVQIRNLLISPQMAGQPECEALMMSARENQTQIQLLYSGCEIAVGELSLKCLAPEAEESGLSDNDGSIVLAADYHGFQFLLTGDLESPGEKRLLSKELLDCYPLLKVGHHGSKTSSSQAFLDQVQPIAAIISCSLTNSFGHPHEEVLERLQEIGSQIWSTAENGGITVEVLADKWRIKSFIGPQPE